MCQEIRPRPDAAASEADTAFQVVADKFHDVGKGALEGIASPHLKTPLKSPPSRWISPMESGAPSFQLSEETLRGSLAHQLEMLARDIESLGV